MGGVLFVNEESFLREFERQLDIFSSSELPQPYEFVISNEKDRTFWANYLIWKRMIE